MTSVENPISPTDRLRRVEVLSDLRVLLNFLEANPDVPMDAYTARIEFCVLADDDETGFAEVRQAAEALGVRPTTSAAGTFAAELPFGNARYRIFYCLKSEAS